ATGDWTLHSLAAELESRGLMQRPTRKRAARPFPANKISEILHNRYYIGFVRYRGVENQGKHAPLVDIETFDAVQRVLKDHHLSGERSYRRRHYLTGSVVCGRCGSRLGFGVSTSRAGQAYEYFFCLGRHSKRTTCTQRYLPARAVEEAVERQWRDERPGMPIDDLRTNLLADFDEGVVRAKEEISRLRHRSEQLNRERFKWAEKAMDGVIPDDIARSKQAQLAAELTKVDVEIAQLGRITDMRREALEAGLRLVADCGEAYAIGGDVLRRAYNQACFTALKIDEIEERPVLTGEITEAPDRLIKVTDADRTSAFQALQTAHLAAPPTAGTGPRQRKTPCSREGYRVFSHVGGSNLSLLVGVAGFEPTTSASRTQRATKLRYTPWDRSPV
ncbi:MAG: site-specific recombinase, partial [Actinomycetota bacterium]|nr:site-specific recombinase [Actinomycetota bacterium]